MERFCEWLAGNFFPNTKTKKFFGSELNSKKSIDSVLSACSNLSLFEGEKLLVLENANRVRATHSKPFCERLKGIRPVPPLVLTGEKINQQTPLLNQLKGEATIVEIQSLSKPSLVKWISKEAKLLGAANGIEPRAASELASCYGNDLQAISSLLSRLTLLLEEEGKITKEFLDKVSLRVPERSTLDLVGLLAQGKTSECLALCDEVVDQGSHPLQILALLSKAFRTMLANRSLGGFQGADRRDRSLDSDLSSPWFVKRLEKSNRLFTERELSLAISGLGSLDLEIKSSGGEPRALLANTLVGISERKNAAI